MASLNPLFLHTAQFSIPQVRHAWQQLKDVAALMMKRHADDAVKHHFGEAYPVTPDEQWLLTGEIPQGTFPIYGYWGEPNGARYIVDECGCLSVLTGLMNK